MDRLKVLLICHFSNPEVRSKLNLRKDREYHDFAVWITNRILAYEKSNALELYVVAPHKGMKYRRQAFVSNGIHYHFYTAGNKAHKLLSIALSYGMHKVGKNVLGSIIAKIREVYLNISYLPQKQYVGELVREIKPDIIHLNGAENPYYSATVLGLEKYHIPICISIQGIVGDPQVLLASNFNDMSRIKIEHEIHSRYKYYIIGSAEHHRLVKLDNPSAVFMHSPGIRTINIDPTVEEVHKEYDFVFMARVTPFKGIEHVLMAMKSLTEDYPDLSLLVLGPVSKKYLSHLQSICKDYGIADRVAFAGHIPLREDLFRQALKAKIFVLPTTFEGLATSAVEAMLLGLPVVTYATGGMPFLNKDGENVLMCETGDIAGLTMNMKRLLKDPDFAERLAKKGQSFAHRVFGEGPNLELNIRQYRAIIENHRDRSPIPADLLFDGTYR